MSQYLFVTTTRPHTVFPNIGRIRRLVRCSKYSNRHALPTHRTNYMDSRSPPSRLRPIYRPCYCRFRVLLKLRNREDATRPFRRKCWNMEHLQDAQLSPAMRKPDEPLKCKVFLLTFSGFQLQGLLMREQNQPSARLMANIFNVIPGKSSRNLGQITKHKEKISSYCSHFIV